MRRVWEYFQRLQWQVTGTAILVAGLTALVAYVLLLGFASVIQTPIRSGDLAVFLATHTPQLRDYLTREPSDRGGLARWLDPVVEDLYRRNPAIGGPSDLIAVVDPDGTIIAASSWRSVSLDMPLTASLAPPVRAILETALEEQRPVDQRVVDGTIELLVAAVPIHADRRLVGAWFVQLEHWSFWSLSNLQYLAEIWPFFALFLGIALIIGAGLGGLLARRLTGRLQRLIAAADTWATGDFRRQVDESHADEIGQVARRFNRMAQQLQRLVDARQELAMLEERNRLARDLHDAVKQHLFAAAMQIAAARARLGPHAADAEPHLTTAEQLAHTARQELATILEELRPVPLSQHNLAEALQNYAASWSRQAGITGTVQIETIAVLPSLVEETLFRVVQEALANVARHSAAQTVTITLRTTTAGIELTVCDDGCGFDGARTTNGMGLASMRERLAALDGRLEVTSAPGQGTVVIAICPTQTVPVMEQSI
jgi:NarL family two-component system sensor histidine kinase LiaS